MQLSHRPHAGPAASAKPFTPGHPHTVSRSILKRSIRTYNHDATTIVKQPNTSSARADAEIVDEILQKIGNTDGGLTITADTRREVDDLLDELERRGLEQQPRPIQNPLLWGNYNVAYTSTSRATEQRGQRTRTLHFACCAVMKACVSCSYCFANIQSASSGGMCSLRPSSSIQLQCVCPRL